MAFLTNKKTMSTNCLHIINYSIFSPPSPSANRTNKHNTVINLSNNSTMVVNTYSIDYRLSPHHYQIVGTAA